MADGDNQHLDRAHLQPAVQTSDHDPFADTRMGGQFERVQYTNMRGVPSCQEIFDTIHQLDVNGPNLVGRMDKFIGGTLKQGGVTFDQLGQMANSPQFSQQDKMALRVMMNGFSHATNTDVANPHMTMQQFGTFLIRSGVQDQCQVPQR